LKKRNPLTRKLHWNKVFGRRMANLKILWLMFTWVLTDKQIRMGQIVVTFKLHQFYEEPVDALARIKQQIRSYNEEV